RDRALLQRGAPRHSARVPKPHALSDPDGRSRHPEGRAERGRSVARGRQSHDRGRHAGPARNGAQGRHRHARAHGVFRRGARPGAPAMDDRLDAASRNDLALSAGVTLYPSSGTPAASSSNTTLSATTTTPAAIAAALVRRLLANEPIT